MCGNRVENPFSLEERTVFITGASSGIGRATAAECAKMGATLVITGRNKERLNETLAALEGEGHTAFTADLSNTQEINDLVEKLPALDGVVLNAGITASLTCQFITEDKLDSQGISTSLRGALAPKQSSITRDCFTSCTGEHNRNDGGRGTVYGVLWNKEE